MLRRSLGDRMTILLFVGTLVIFSCYGDLPLSSAQSIKPSVNLCCDVNLAHKSDPSLIEEKLHRCDPEPEVCSMYVFISSRCKEIKHWIKKFLFWPCLSFDTKKRLLVGGWKVSVRHTYTNTKWTQSLTIKFWSYLLLLYGKNVTWHWSL